MAHIDRTQKLILGLLDKAMPRGAQGGMPVEEQARARMLVFLQFLLVACSALCLAFSLIYICFFSAVKYWNIFLILAVAFCGYCASLWVFHRKGLRIVSGNILAFTLFTAHELILLALPYEMQLASLQYLLALPFLVTIVADYRSGIFWLVMVSMAPIFLHLIGPSHYGYYYLVNWIASSIGLFLAIYSSQVYIKNFSERLQIERNSFEYDAQHDSLTGLVNRATFDKRLQESIELCLRESRKAVLVFLDLDKFKPINDDYGHQAGDQILKEIAARLTNLVRGTDSVARLGGDEFAILFDNATLEIAEPIINRIVTVIGMPVDVFGNSLSVGCSLGVVLCPDDGRDPEALAKRADEQMYAAKRGKK